MSEQRATYNSEEEKETPAELGEIISTCGFQLGIVAGIESVADELRKRAGKLFARDSDEEAELYRDIAKDLEVKARAARAEYEARYKPEKKRAFLLLEGMSND